MNCLNATSPIDLVNINANDCSLKCEYSFKYPMTSLTGRNNGDYLLFSLEQQQSTPVLFNKEKYYVESMRLYRPSLHTFNGSKADAELIIIHNHLAGTNNLLVCIPIMGVSSNTDMFDRIISQMGEKANKDGEMTNIILNSFSLQKIVPSKPYYYYTGSLPYSPCNGSYEYVVFDKKNALQISSSSLRLLNSLITESKYTTKQSKNGFYYNKSGPKTSLDTGEDEIYIECNPTGEDGEILVPKSKKSLGLEFGDTMSKIINNTIFKIVMIILAVLIGLKLLSYGFNTLLKKLIEGSNTAKSTQVTK
jgi:carbonic anhydrase